MTEAPAAPLDAPLPGSRTRDECYDEAAGGVEHDAADPKAPPARSMNSASPRTAAPSLGIWVRSRAAVIAAIATTFLAAFAAGSFAMDVVRGFEERIYARMDARFDAMDQRFEAMDQRFEAMEQRFEALEADVEALRRDFEAFRTEVRRDVDALNENVSALREEVALIRGAVIGVEVPADGAGISDPGP